MNDDELSRAYAAARRARAAMPVGDRPTLDELTALASGEVQGAEREALLERTLRSGAVHELTVLRSVVSAVDEASAERARDAREVDVQRDRIVRPSGRVRAIASGRWWPVAAAAAVLLTIGIPVMIRSNGDRSSAPDEATYRAANGRGPLLLSPNAGTSPSTGQRFMWSAVPGAAEYLLELVDADGQAVARVSTRDTVATLPVGMADGRVVDAEGWWVIASSAGGLQSRSALRLFRDRTDR